MVNRGYIQISPHIFHYTLAFTHDSYQSFKYITYNTAVMTGQMKLLVAYTCLVYWTWVNLMNLYTAKIHLQARGVQITAMLDSMEKTSNSIGLLLQNTSRVADPECPMRNFAFIKTHKTGSTTVTNMLLRYTENNNLNLIMSPLVYFIKTKHCQTHKQF